MPDIIIFGCNPIAMPSFTKSFVTPEGMLTFSLDRFFRIQGVVYYVSVPHQEFDKTNFSMLKSKEGVWVILNKAALPDWIIELEPSLATAIIGHEA